MCQFEEEECLYANVNDLNSRSQSFIFSFSDVSYSKTQRTQSSTSLPVHFTAVGCYGSEEKLNDCGHHEYTISDPSMDISISCISSEDSSSSSDEDSSSSSDSISIAALVIAVMFAFAVIVLIAVQIFVLLFKQRKKAILR